MNLLAKNLRYLRKRNKKSQEELSVDLEITRSRLGAYEEGRSEPSVDMLIAFSEFFHVSIDVMVKADLTFTPPESIMKMGTNRLLFPITMDITGRDNIEMIPVKTVAGYLRGFADPEFIKELPQMRFPFAGNGKFRAFPIVGDSMPPVKPGDYIIARYVESVSDLADGHKYILLLKNEGLVFKRVYQKRKLKRLELVSDNVHYKPYQIPVSDVLEFWEFAWLLGKANHKMEEELAATVKNLQERIDLLTEAIRTKQG